MLFDNKYEFVKDLGSGGFGKVFLAKEKLADRTIRHVAIKQLHNKDKEKQLDIIYEIEVVVKFNHPNIAAYKTHFWQDGLLFLVMEYCTDGNLWSVINDKKVPEQIAFDWTLTLAETLAVVHEEGIVHHDLKPGNILLTENGLLKISDFGMANSGGGTRAFMAPELFQWSANDDDPRIDVYALGVTLMEMLTGKNPFYTLSREEIIALHDKGDFPIKELPSWQQEIILKAINKIPELRFQSMVDFADAIKSKQVPFILNREIIKAGNLAEKIEWSLNHKKWNNARRSILTSEELEPNVNIYKATGKYYLLTQNIKKAKKNYEQALKLNSRLDVQKELGWINLEMENYPTAISLLSDHLHRNPTDYEGYNLLLKCFYETDRYEAAMQLAKMMMEVAPDINCFANNYYISHIMQFIGQTILPDTVMKAKDENVFIDYNHSVILEEDKSHDYLKKPTLKSKLLFQDYRFTHKSEVNESLEITNKQTNQKKIYKRMIIKIGRVGFDNLIELKGNAVSRRHCLIVNTKNDVMLYDLESTGTYLNNSKVKKKIALIEFSTLRIAEYEFEIKPDCKNLF